MRGERIAIIGYSVLATIILGWLDILLIEPVFVSAIAIGFALVGFLIYGVVIKRRNAPNSSKGSFTLRNTFATIAVASVFLAICVTHLPCQLLAFTIESCERSDRSLPRWIEWFVDRQGDFYVTWHTRGGRNGLHRSRRNPPLNILYQRRLSERWVAVVED